MMLRLLPVIFLVIVSTVLLNAQPLYLQSAGVRLGHTSGITYKKFIQREEAVELIMSGRREGMQLTALYLIHKPMELSFNENFYVYYGLGGHIGFESYDRLSKQLVRMNPPEFEFQNRSYQVMGIDAMIGVEYRWLTVPMTISFDIKPYYNYIGMRYSKAMFWDSAITFKYVF